MNIPYVKTFQVYTIILDSSSDTAPSAPSLSTTNTESQVTSTSQTRNATPVTALQKNKITNH